MSTLPTESTLPAIGQTAAAGPAPKLAKTARLTDALPKAKSAQGIAHRMANDIGVAIVNGELRDGTRILEEELAAHYSVSRSPVREAIGLLERRGLVRTEPRRGTYVVGFTPDLIADLFNVRGVLTGLAARYVARQRDPQALADLQEVARALAQANLQPDITPMQFAKIANGFELYAFRAKLHDEVPNPAHASSPSRSAMMVSIFIVLARRSATLWASVEAPTPPLAPTKAMLRPIGLAAGSA